MGCEEPLVVIEYDAESCPHGERSGNLLIVIRVDQSMVH